MHWSSVKEFDKVGMYYFPKDLEFITEFIGVNISKMLRELIDEGRKIKGVLHSYTGISFLPA